MKERLWKIEGLFSEGKNCHGLLRAKLRGLPKVQMQAYMTAVVQNLKRLIQVPFGDLLAAFLFLIVDFRETFSQTKLQDQKAISFA